MNALRKVRLEGRFGELFGKKWELNCQTPRQAVSLINANSDGEVYRYLSECTQKGIGFYVIHGDDKPENYLKTQEVAEPLKDPRETLTIIPVPVGAGDDGILSIIIGIALVGIGLFVGGPFGALSVSAGLSLTIGGASQLIAGSPNFEPPRENASEPSYLFGGPITKTRPGGIYDITYGTMIKGGLIVSAGIENTQTSTTGTGGIGNPFDPNLGDGFGGYPDDLGWVPL